MATKYTHNTFVLSDESDNSHGHRIKTDGIDLERFRKNPVMFLNHEPNEIIGKWENIRVEGGKLLANAVFDTKSAKGAEVQRQVNDGFLRAVSVGIIVKQIDEIDGVEYITQSELAECSIVTIPANPNALRTNGYQSLGEGKKICFTFGENDPFKLIGAYNDKPLSDNELKNFLKQSLNLNTQATNADLFKAFWKEFAFQKLNSMFEKAVSIGMIDKEEKKYISKVFSTDPTYFETLMKKKFKDHSQKVEEVVKDAVERHYLLYYDMELYKSIGNELGVNKLRQILRTTPKPMRAVDVIEGGKDYDRKNWGLKEWRTYDPETLAKDEKLYNFLIEKEQRENGLSVTHTLDWYRKNDPKALQKDRALYERLLNAERVNK